MHIKPRARPTGGRRTTRGSGRVHAVSEATATGRPPSVEVGCIGKGAQTPLGTRRPARADGRQSPGYFHADELFVSDDGEPTRGLHIAFQSPDRETVDRFHETALAAGGRDSGAPGERP